jgi:hypothetical protein
VRGEHVTTTGLEAVMQHIYALAAGAYDQRAQLEQAGREAQRRIGGIPVDTGRLTRGVHGGTGSVLDVANTGFKIATTVPYARMVFKGTKYMRARAPSVPSNIGPRTALLVLTDLMDRAT